MTGVPIAIAQSLLDYEFVNSDYIAYSTNGTSEMASLARTSIGSWAAATAADPSVKANAGALVSAAYGAAGPVTVTHFAIYSASSAGTQKTDWTPLTNKALSSGDQLTHAAGAIAVTMT